jgi:hypothetical protein
MSHVRRFAEYVAYIAAFCLFYSLSGLAIEGITRLAGYPDFRTGLLPPRFLSGILWIVPYATCQVVAAGVAVRGLSLKRLLCFSCLFIVISHLLSALSIRMTMAGSGLSVVSGLISITVGSLLPYLAPILILALMGRKRAPQELVLPAGPESMGAAEECRAAVGAKQAVGTGDWCRRYWFVLDLLLAGFLGLCGALADPFGLISYGCGLYNDGGTEFLLVMLLVLLFVPAALCLLVLGARMSATWPKRIHNKARLRLLRTLTAIGVVSGLVLPFTPLRPPGYKTYAAGFRRYMRSEADLPAIRYWLSSLDANDLREMKASQYGGDGSRPRGPNAIAWPSAIARLHPGYVELDTTKDGQPKIRLTWGGGFGHWGAEIGPEGMEVPATLERKGEEFGPPGHRYTVYDTGEYRLPFAPGAYVWYEIQ